MKNETKILFNGEEMDVQELMRKVELGAVINELTVRCTETFKKRDYESKSYEASITTDWSHVPAILENLRVEDAPAFHQGFAKLIYRKIHNQDRFLRDRLRRNASLDGVQGADTDMRDRERNEAYNEGWMAAKEGRARGDNPHAATSESSGKAWDSGWLEGSQ